VDDGFVRELQQALGDLGQDVWIDSGALRGGDRLWPEIQKAIEEASGLRPWVVRSLRAKAPLLLAADGHGENELRIGGLRVCPAWGHWPVVRRPVQDKAFLGAA